MIGVTRDGHVMTLELQRPERRNALNVELVDALREAVERAAGEDVRAIVLTGQGHVFSSGADLTDPAGVAEHLPEKAKALNIAIDQAPVPVIGAINGPAIGAGVILSMICDLRVVSPDAYFQFPVAKYGLALDNWSIRRLTSLVGAGRTRGMLMAAERLTAEVALQTGMANRIGTLAEALGLPEGDVRNIFVSDSRMPSWYAAIKSRIIEADHRPELIIVGTSQAWSLDNTLPNARA
ncbi:MAG: enoyl-CoA hydratase, partial [Mycobacterium sp.]